MIKIKFKKDSKENLTFGKITDFWENKWYKEKKIIFGQLKIFGKTSGFWKNNRFRKNN